MRDKHTLVLIYNSFKDPLFQNLILKYITRLAQNKHLKFHLITFEQPQFEMSEAEISIAKMKLADTNIFWHPLLFHTGPFILFKKLWDVLQVSWLTYRIKRKYKLTFTLAFANVSAAISSILSTVFNLKLLIYSYEPHAEFMVEMGLWSSKSVKFKILKHLESFAAKKAYHIITGTNAMKSELQKTKESDRISVGPTAVDPKDFYYSGFDRKRIRESMGANIDQKILLYIGKFGGLYFDTEIIELLITISNWNQNYVPMIITDYDKEIIGNWFRSKGGDPSRLILKNSIDKSEVKSYLSAADMGIIGIPPLPFQRFRSPTKTAEYMLCGLPYIVCSGVSEDDIYANKYDLGCVVHSFSENDLNQKKSDIIKYLDVDREHYYVQSRAVALEYRSLERVHRIFENIYKD